MKRSKIFLTLMALAAGALLTGCQQKEQEAEARAVATSATYVSFVSTGAESQVINVYADGVWNVDVDSDWISVTPMKGNGHGEITISVTDNATGSTIDRPRDGKIIVQGKYASRQTSVIVHQDGDTYYGVKTYKLSELSSLEDGSVGKVSGAQVIALTQSGFVLQDETGSIYATGMGVKLGDVLAFNGTKASLFGGTVFNTDEINILSNSEVKYAEASDMTSKIEEYKGGVVYALLKGSLVNGMLKVGKANVQLIDPAESLELGAVDLHKVSVTGFVVGVSGASGYMVATKVEDEGADETLVPYPLRWAVGKDLNYSKETFTKDTPRIDPIQGIGYIEYVPYDLEHTDGSGSYKLDVESNNPRVTGPWVNDYWLFYGNGAVKAGTEVQISLEMRSSKWGMKYWVLEYLDGEEWKLAPDVKYTTEAGEEAPYHIATDENNTNQPLVMPITFRKNNEHLQIRLRCSVLWRGGGGTTAARSTASSRLTVTNPDDDTYKPAVIILKEGNGIEKDPVYANIEVSTELLTFNGTPGEPKELTITSDHDFTVSTSASWLSLDQTEGVAGEPLVVKVTCEESQLSELRQGTIRIVSEDSEQVVNVVQSAAGQILDPFVSISGGNKAEVNELEGTLNVKIQSNVEVSVETADTWIKVEAAPETKALVDWTEYTVSYEANESAEPRTGTIRFFNEKEKVESILTLVQSGKEPEPEYPEGVYFQDDFEWLAPYIKAWVDANPGDAEKLDPVSSNMASHSQPNIWNVAALTSSVGAELEKRGYTDLNKSAKTLYMQKNYFKMGASNKHTGLQLPAIKFGTTPVDADLSFDWCAHMTGAGVIDKVTITVEIVEGPGKFSDTGTKLSAEIATAQEANQLAWQHAKVKLVGVTDDTRIQIHPTHYNDGAGASQQRWHLDNIKVAEPAVEVGDVLWTEWWQGASANQTPSAYSASDARTTKTFGNASVTYSEGGSGTAIKADGLVYYNSKDNIANEDYRYNLLVAKSGGYLDASGIPCKGVKTATLTYRSNTQLASHQVTSSTTGVTIGELSASSVPKLDLDSKNTYTLTCTVTIADGVEKLNLRITDIGTANIRVDGIELVVKELK
ncbi:MAG: BACON domain-containing protein [Bacteroidales bacterium]|nr:BACON domain-containing protein [Bacteroidales bacterium]